jgi:hypothetical protein
MATATVAGGPVTGITITNGGGGYTSAPTITISGGGGADAAAAATVGGGPLTGILLTDGGSGYTFTPNITISGGGGTGATATATVVGGVVTGITITNLGGGYTSAPNVTISSSGGTVNLQYPAVKVTIGLPYTAQACTLPLVLQMDANGQGRTKNLNKVWLRLFQSSAIFAGPSPASLTQYKQRTTENYGQPPNLVTDEVEITIPASWQTSGQVTIQQTDPLPLTLVGLTVEAVIGG